MTTTNEGDDGDEDEDDEENKMSSINAKRQKMCKVQLLFLSARESK